ncbi:MAG TPA: Uma2 family endonuclease [Nannocystis sp.]|jgi:Uma2 family endonuclease
MPAPAVRRATYQDVLDAPENMIAEVLYGTLYTMPRPAFSHARVSSRLGVALGKHFDDEDGPTGWLLLDEPELHLGSEPDILVPDLAGWRLARVQPGMDDAPWTSIAPDWICEVLSPATHVRDRGIKLDIYLRERVGHVWLVDPIAETLEIFRHNGTQWSRGSLHTGNVTVRAEPFDAIELELARLWKRRAPPQP